jgi:hypothetical protein
MSKICLNCNLEFFTEISHTKYCSEKCKKRFHNQKELLKRKTDPIYKKIHLEREKLRKRKKRLWDKEYRLKWNLKEKTRYRQKNNIKSDYDLKVGMKGSGTLTRYGYRQITKKDHPNCNRCGTMFEHVFVMSEFLKRPLQKHENVHHKNGIRHDNRIENLELWSRSQPPGQRVEDKLSWCKEFLEQYGHKVIMKSDLNEC